MTQEIDCVALISDLSTKKTLVEAIQVADLITAEDQVGLAAHLLAGMRGGTRA